MAAGAIWDTTTQMGQFLSVEFHNSWAGWNAADYDLGAQMRVYALSPGAVSTAAAPSIVTQPSIAGGSTAGSILSANNGTASGSPSPTATRQWLSNGTPIPGATGSTFDTTGRTGQQISLRVTWTNSGGSATATSPAITIGAVAQTYLVNGTFDADLAGWTAYAPLADYSARPLAPQTISRTSAGRMRQTVAADAIYPFVQTTLSNLTVGQAYTVAVNRSGSDQTYQMSVYNTGGANPSGLRAQRVNVWQTGVQTLQFTATQTSHVFELMLQSQTPGVYTDYDDITVTPVEATVDPTLGPIADQTMTVGDANRTVPLTVSNVASITVSPSGQGVTVSGTSLVLSAATVRNGVYTVTAASSSGAIVSRSFNFTVAVAAGNLPVIQNGTFDTDTAGWTAYAPLPDYSSRPLAPQTISRTSAGRMRQTVTADAIYPFVQTTITNLTVGQTYAVAVDRSASDQTYRMTVYNSGGATPSGQRAQRIDVWQTGVQTLQFTATQTSHVFELMLQSQTPGVFTDYDNITVTPV
jgi:hypothetical protein